GVNLDRKNLSRLSIEDQEAFQKLVEIAKSQL
ncbi:MAG TPA: 50S ribosomal protein L20, partial [Candidatus Atribacteria bacterium]|nr:50S ribosomal protein L20 [Candidatus Atribacteria bacterium]